MALAQLVIGSLLLFFATLVVTGSATVPLFTTPILSWLVPRTLAGMARRLVGGITAQPQQIAEWAYLARVAWLLLTVFGSGWILNHASSPVAP